MEAWYSNGESVSYDYEGVFAFDARRKLEATDEAEYAIKCAEYLKSLDRMCMIDPAEVPVVPARGWFRLGGAFNHDISVIIVNNDILDRVPFDLYKPILSHELAHAEVHALHGLEAARDGNPMHTEACHRLGGSAYGEPKHMDTWMKIEAYF